VISKKETVKMKKVMTADAKKKTSNIFRENPQTSNKYTEDALVSSIDIRE